MKLSCGNAAERHTFQAIFRCQRQAGAVAGSQQLFVGFGHTPINDGSNRMQHIAAGQIERGRDFCTPGRFGIALLFHQFRTGKAQLHTSKGMNGVINTAMVRDISAGHTAVGCVDDGINAYFCDVGFY